MKQTLRESRAAKYGVKLTPVKAEQIRVLWATGRYTRTALGNRFGVHYQTVTNILRGTAWRDRRLSSAEWQAERAEHHRATRERQLREIAALVF